MDVTYINPFINGTLKVLKTMASLDTVAGKPFVKKAHVTAGDVSSIIGITGDVVGSMAISFSESCICSIVGAMLGEVFPEVNKDVLDGAGEITNIVSGVARSDLEKDGLKVFAAIPTVVHGKGHTVLHILDTASIVVPFSTEKGDFVIDVCIKTVEATARKDQSYRVLNISTSVMVRPPVQLSSQVRTEMPAAPVRDEEKRISFKDAKNDVEKNQIIREKLAEFITRREEIMKELSEKPFMPLDRRRMLKKNCLFMMKR